MTYRARELDSEGVPLQPLTATEVRLCCLRIATACHDQDSAIKVDAVIQQAATLERYVIEGATPSDPIIKIVGLPDA